MSYDITNIALHFLQVRMIYVFLYDTDKPTKTESITIFNSHCLMEIHNWVAESSSLGVTTRIQQLRTTGAWSAKNSFGLIKKYKLWITYVFIWHDDQCSSHKLTMSCFIKNIYIDIFVPVGKCSLIDQLSTCSVALPPFLVKRTTWYFPSFTGVLLSSTLMSTVPMLKVTPILPCCWRKERTKRNNYDIVLLDVQVVLIHLTWCGSSIVASQLTLFSACMTSSS